MSDAREQREARRLAKKAERQRRRRAEIITEATRLVDEGEFEFSVQRLADRLGISQPSVFYYFEGGKDELLTEVAWSDFARYQRELREACEAASDGTAALEALVRTRQAQFERDWQRFAFVIDTIFKVPLTETGRAEDFYKLLNAVFEVVAEKIADDQQTGGIPADIDPRLRTHSIHRQVSGLLFGLAIQRRAEGTSKHPPEMIFDDLCDQIRRAMRP